MLGIHARQKATLSRFAGDMVDAMAQGSAALRAAHRGMDADTVADTMDELQAAMEANQEVSDAMSMPLPGQIDDVSLNTRRHTPLHIITCCLVSLTQFELEDDLAELDAELERDATPAAHVAPVAAATTSAAATAPVPAQGAASTATAVSSSAAANAAASALPMAPTAELPGTAAPAASAAGGADEMDDELRRLEAEMGV